MSMRPGRPGPPAGGAAAPLNAAIAHHQAGRLKEADAAYRQVLAAMPKHFDAMHLLGVVALQTGRLDEAHALISDGDRDQPEVRRRAEQSRQCPSAPGPTRRRAGLLRARGQAPARLRRCPLQPRQSAAAARPAAGCGDALPPRRRGRRQIGAGAYESRRHAARPRGRARGRARAGDRGQAEARPCRGTVQSRHRALQRRRIHSRARSARPRAEARSEVHAGSAQSRHRARTRRPPRGSAAVPGERACARASIGRGALQSRQRAARQRRSGRSARTLPPGGRARSRIGRGADRSRARPAATWAATTKPASKAASCCTINPIRRRR